MEEIIRQYGRMICVLAAVAALLSMLFAGGSKGGLMRRLAGWYRRRLPWRMRQKAHQETNSSKKQSGFAQEEICQRGSHTG